MNRARTQTTLAIAAIAIMLAGCETTPMPVTVESTPAMPFVEFIPADAVADLQYLEGKYQNLLAATSTAVWVNDAVAALKRKKDADLGIGAEPQLEHDAEVITEAFVVIECFLESEFPDMGMAYEAVGLRNFDVRIELAHGKRIDAVQRLPKVPVEEEQAGALKHFRRQIVLIFPKRDYVTGENLFTSKLDGTKLVLEGNGTKFYFDWPTALPGASGTGQTTVSDAVKAVRTGFREFFLALRPIAHTFD